MEKITVLSMASSAYFAAFVARQLASEPDIDLVGSVFSIDDAMAAVAKVRPAVALIDMRTAGLQPGDFIRRIKRTGTASFVLLTEPDDVRLTFLRPLISGVANLPKRDSALENLKFTRELLTLIRRSSRVGERRTVNLSYLWQPGRPFSTHFNGIIAIGASAGGTEATQEVLQDLPVNTPGIIVTQHMPANFTAIYAQRLNSRCKMTVKEAKDYDRIVPGTVLIAPGDRHMQVQVEGTPHPIVRCKGQEKVGGHCPSVDVMFESVARTMGDSAIGIILTGMGADGAEGLLSMRRRGCFTIGQDEHTSVVYGMPQVAYQKGAVASQLPLPEIPLALMSHLMKM